MSGRCPWAGPEPIYVKYHDEEWGVPEVDDRTLFEKLTLEGFQAGLSWITILKKRTHFRELFDNFEAEKMARYDDEKVAALLGNPKIIRHRGKIEAAISNAKAFLALKDQIGFAEFVWGFVDGRPTVNHFRTINDLPAQTEVSSALARELKAKGFRFCGPTTVYAFMQSMGLVNDHLVDCPRHAFCAALAQDFVLPRPSR